MSLSPIEQEVVIGWNEEEDFVRVDVTIINHHNQIIKTLDEVVAEGKGKLVHSAEENRIYHIDKGVFNFFTRHYKRELSDEAREALRERARKMQKEYRNSASTPDEENK